MRSDLERVVDALRGSEEQFRAIFEQANDGIFLADSTGRYLDVNVAGARMLGFTREEILDLTIADLAAPHDRARAADSIDRLLRGERFSIRTDLLHRDGSMVATEVSASRLSDGRLLGIVHDVSEHVRIEEELRHHQAVLAAVSFAAERFLQVPFWEDHVEEVLERVGRAMRVDRAYVWTARTTEEGDALVRRLHGWGETAASPDLDTEIPLGSSGLGFWVEHLRRGEVIGLPISEYPEPFRTSLAAGSVRAILIVPILIGHELWGCLGFTDHAQERAWSALEIEALRVAAGILGSLVRRQRTEEALRDSEEKYRTLVEGANQPIVMVGRNGVFRFANGTAAADLGLAPEEVVGRTMWDIFPSRNADAQMAMIRAALDAGEPRVESYRTEVRGAVRWYEARIQPVRNQQGIHDAVLVIASDIHERKLAEERIHSYQTRLRSLTSELALTEQRERREIAAELHDRIGQALAVSKMKLGALRSAAAGGPLESSVQEVWDLVDHAMQETRSLTFEVSPPILHELGLEPALEWLVERTHEQHGIRAAFHDDHTTKRLDADLQGVVFKAVQELLLNVVKHASAHQVDVSVRRAGDEMEIRVEDDGVGFRPADALYRTGFGLFSIRERIEHLGGRIDIESEPSRGTRILLVAPIASEAEDRRDP